MTYTQRRILELYESYDQQYHSLKKRIIKDDGRGLSQYQSELRVEQGIIAKILVDLAGLREVILSQGYDIKEVV